MLDWSIYCKDTYIVTAIKQQFTHMLGEFNSFHRDIKGGCVFVSGELPPPLDHLNRFRLSFCPRWRAEELEANFRVDVQHTIRANKLKDEGNKY